MLFISQPRVGRLHNEILAMQMVARARGWDTHGAHFGWRLPDEVIESKVAGCPYGSQTFCEVICQQMNWGLIGNSHDWLTKIPQKFLKREVKFCLLKEARNLEFEGSRFIKPADDKCFDAKIYTEQEFDPPIVVLDDTPVIISDPVEFTEEYRCFVDGKKCLTVSCYLYHGEINEPKNWYNPNCIEAEKFVNKAISAVPTVPSVVDVGIMENGWAVIESNQAWASGIYGCEPDSVLTVLEQTCYKL